MSSIESSVSGMREAAFGVLRALARDAAQRGRPCFAASAKPQMAQRLGYDERALGYETFRELLADAEAAGFIRLTYVQGGDVELGAVPVAATASSAASAAPAQPPQQEAPAGRLHLRRDFWNAVVKPGTWLYDPKNDAVVTQASAVARDDLVPMPTADDVVQIGWIEEFVQGLPKPRQDALGPVLIAAADLDKKLETMRQQPQTVRNSWFNHRSHRVHERLEEWKREHALDVQLLSPRVSRRETSFPVRTHPRRQSASSPSEDVVRARLRQAIERMPLAELLRLPIPAEFLIDA